MSFFKSIFSPYFYIQLVVNWRFKWAGLKRKVFETERFIINYWDNNNGKPALVLVQAFAAESQYTWHKQVGKLHKDYRLIVPNFLYFGGSDMKGERSYEIKDQVEAIRELLDHLGVESAIFCGASYGGVVSIEFADLYPNRVSKLVMTNSPLKYDTQEDLDAVLEDFGLASKTDLFVPQDYGQLHKLFGISYYRKPPFPKFVFRSIYQNLYQDVEGKRKLVDASTVELNKLRDKDYKLEIPIYLLWGAHDRLCPASMAYQLQEHFGDKAQVQIVPKTAHMPNFERPRVYNKYLLDFLKS